MDIQDDLLVSSTTAMSRQKRPLDPILIGSFPSPPTHIPPTPTTPNPPPSRPPSAPLPPVPGPSRISAHDSLLLLSSSHRSSNFSIASHESFASTSSPRISSVARPPSTTSPPRSPTSLSYNTPSIAFSIQAHDELTVDDLTRMSISPMPPLSDNDDDDDEELLMRFTQSPKSTSFTRSHQANESISSIDMRDLMLDNDDDDDNDDEHHDREILADLPAARPRPGRSKHRPNEPSLADPIDPQTLHLQFRASRSTSESHRQMLRNRSKSRLELEISQPPTATLPPLPSAKVFPTNPSSPGRASSPDIMTILSTTPRPSRHRTGSSSRPSTSISARDRSSSRLASDRPRVDSLPDPRSRVSSLSKSTPSVQRRASEGIISSVSASTIDAQLRKPRRSDPAVEPPYSHSRQYLPDDGGDDDDDARSWIEHDEFGKPIDRDRTFNLGNGSGGVDAKRRALERERRARDLEVQLEGGGSDSDSSLDLHTPLPHLMLRHGLLSPHSKLLPQSQEAGPRPDSVISLASNHSAMTNGLAKDTRDTPMRRTRHRDGRLLRGGIGLTTGLGWSDSEDEDAPSPLTRRISSLNLSRNSSVSSMHSSYSHSTSRSYSSRSSSRVHPLSRSYSSGTLTEDRRHFDDDGFDELDEFGQYRTTSGEWSSSSLPQKKRDTACQPRTSNTLSSSSSGSRSSLPPTAWQKRQGGKSKGGNSNGRTSTSSAGSHFSLEVSIPEHEHEYDEPTTVATRTPNSNVPVYHSNGKGDDVVNTPSTASTLSIPLPITPRDDHPSPDFSPVNVVRKLDKEKSLPPLPPSLKRSPASSSTLSLQARNGTQQIPRSRTYSSASSSSASHKPSNISPPTMPPPPLLTTATKPSLMSTPRPLRLAQPNIGQRGDRPAVPVPSVSYINGNTGLRSPLPSPLLTPSRSAPGGLNSAGLSGNSYYSNSTSSMALPVSPPGTPGASPKPKPRTGTGMVYRSTSSYTSTSRMRLPSTAKSTTTARGVPIAL
ncbi:hypothetical protein BDZ94DRAFT_1321935 [Collybia nuda]|uniref:Uncharacterized protein n=1 Tax=Collybia nuda TaxID=64659 RepID=A0A9P5Y6M5_9AGAR|nr:hypothetical protein BDZ94DRAFT_1321935 [Collybia nuda]